MIDNDFREMVEVALLDKRTGKPAHRINLERRLKKMKGMKRSMSPVANPETDDDILVIAKVLALEMAITAIELELHRRDCIGQVDC